MSAGFLVVDKPPGLTSHDVVAILRAVTGLKKVGHTGTLDPFATGVLPLALGSATRLIQYLDEDEKVYDAGVVLGTATDTGDPTGTVIVERPVPPLERAAVERVLAGFLGTRMQTPPKYSAVKVAGRPLYSYARAGEAVEVKARPVRIDAMELTGFDPPLLRVLIRCSRGTYARVLAEEVGEALGTAGHLGELRRLGSGPFRIEHAIGLSRVAEIVAGDPDWTRVLRPGRDGERVPWRPREQVLAGLVPWVTTPRDALRHLPAVALSPLAARRWAQTGEAPDGPPGAPRYLLLVGDEVLGVVVTGEPPRPPPPPEPEERRPGPPRRPPRREPG